MILNKNIIDTALEARSVSEQAQKEAFLEKIEGKMGELRGLTKHIADIMETYSYVRRKDEGLSKSVWSALCGCARNCELDFCNAIREDDKCGVRINYTNKCTKYTDLYVTAKNVVTLKSGDFTMDYVRNYLADKFVSEYEAVYKAILFMIDAVPKYAESVSEQIDGIFSTLKTR